MALKVTVKSGPTQGQTYDFADDVPLVTFGRDLKCNVQFPAELNVVGREHFSLKREAGGYEFRVNSGHYVAVGGREAYDGLELSGPVEVRLGNDAGPSLLLEPIRAASNMGDTGNQQRKMRDTRYFLDLARRNIVVVAGVVLVLGLVGWAVARNFGGRLDETVTQIAGVATSLGEIAVQQRHTAEIADFTPMIAKVRDSVYFVTILDKFGEPLANKGATAWVVADKDGKKIFATNGHVAEMLKEARQDPDAQHKLVVRSPAAGHRTHEITDVVIHPGYEAFAAYQKERAPQMEGGLMRPFGTYAGYDVAYMIPKDQDGIAEPLTIANREEKLVKLQAGDPLFFVGYPAEGTDPFDPKKPTPTSQRGNITSQTSFFMTPGGAQNHLLQYSMGVTGGASGSPIFNAKGEVVALVSAASFAGNRLTGRIPSGVLINFGQRADLFQELIAGTADAAMATYRASWEAEVKDFERPIDSVLAEVMGAFKRVTTGATTLLERDLRLEAADSLSNGHPAVTVSQKLDGQSRFLFLAYTTDRRPLSLFIYGPSGGPSGDVPLVTNDAAIALVYVDGSTQDEMDARIAVVSAQKDESGNPVMTPVDAKLIILRAPHDATTTAEATP